MSTVAPETTAPKAQASQSGFASVVVVARAKNSRCLDRVRSRR